MRALLAISLLVLAAACTTPPTSRPVVQAKDLPPLGPCPASSWKPEASPPSASARTSMVLLAVGEWGRFGKQVITYSKNAAPRTEQLGIKEREAPQRIADYWAAVDKTLSGADDVPWISRVPAYRATCSAPTSATRSTSSGSSSGRRNRARRSFHTNPTPMLPGSAI
jgi:hypothetical protein